MPDFIHSWAFWFLVAFIIFIVGFALGFIVSAVLAVEIRKARIDQRLGKKPEIEVITYGKPEDG